MKLRSALALAVLLPLAASAATNMPPRPPTPTRPPAPQQPSVPSQLPQLQVREPILKNLAVAAALKQVLTKKKLFQAHKLKSVLRYRGNIPVLTLKGRQIHLEPLHEPTIPASARRALPAQLVQKLKKYEPWCKKFKFGPLLKIDIGKFILNKVDHRSWQTGVRDQKTRGTCVAHASVAVLESLYKRGGKVADLSENHAYNVFMAGEGSNCMADPGLKTWKAAGYLTANRICRESDSPYIQTTANTCQTIPAACNTNKKHGYVTTATIFAPAFGGTGTNVATNTNYLESLLVSGNDVVMGVYVAGTDWSDGSAESGVVDVQKDANGNPAAAYGGHAMAMVGYDQTKNYFIFKNSWGTGKGHAGYFYLTYEYLQAYAKYGYIVTKTTTPSN